MKVSLLKVRGKKLEPFLKKGANGVFAKAHPATFAKARSREEADLKMPQNNRLFDIRHTKNLALPGKRVEILRFRSTSPSLLHYGNNGGGKYPDSSGLRGVMPVLEPKWRFPCRR
jgi:hypothetical protein